MSDFYSKLMQSRAPDSDDPNLCTLLQMKAHPYFGVYSENYSWALPIGKFEPKNTNQIFKGLPSAVRHDLKSFNEMASSPQFKFMVLNLNLEELYHDAFVQKNLKKIRLNTVLHPLLYRTAKQGEEYQRKMLLSIYPITDAITAVKETEGVPISPKDGILKTQELLVHLHPTEDGGTAISPNNAAFLISSVHPLISFYMVCVCRVNSRMMMLTAQVNMVNNPRLDLIKNVDLVLNHQKLMLSTPSRGQISAHDKEFKVATTYAKMLPIMVKEVASRIKNTFAYYCELMANKKLDTPAICQNLKKLFKELYTNEIIEAPSPKQMAQEWLGYFYRTIWILYHRPQVDGFGELLFSKAPIHFQIELIRKFMISTIDEYQNSVKYQVDMIAELIKPDYQFEYEPAPQLSLKPVKEDHKLSVPPSSMIKSVQLPPSGDVDVKDQQDEPLSLMKSMPKEELKLQAPKLLINSGAQSDASIRRGIQNKFLDNEVYKVVQNPDSSAFQALLEGAMENNVSKLIDGVEMMNPALQAHMFSYIWQLKGRVYGVHHDLGRCAFFCSPQVPACYHLGGQQRIEFLLHYQDILNALDKKYSELPKL